MPRVVPSRVVALMEALFPPFLSSASETYEGPNAQQAMPVSYRGQLEAVLTLLEQIPEELITLEGEDYTNLLASIAAIRSILKTWQTYHKHDLNPIPGISSLNPVVVIHHALARCPDEFPGPGTAELRFLQPDDLRENLRLDISTANRALTNGEWKAATVLSGAVVEALLLWKIQQYEPAKMQTAIDSLPDNSLKGRLNKNPEKWDLHAYIEVTAALGVISPGTAKQARLAKDFRNLIHPGRAARTGQVCDRGTALSAMAAVEHVVRDLTP
jgi:hypothetical protein